MESWNLYDHVDDDDEDPVDLALLGFGWIEALYLLQRPKTFILRGERNGIFAHREYLMLLVNGSKRRLICTRVERRTVCIIFF